MKKYKLDGEIYYRQGDKFYDSNYIEVDIATRNKLIKLVEQEIFSPKTIVVKPKPFVIETPKPKTPYKPYNPQKEDNVSPLKDRNFSLTEPQLSDYGIDKCDYEEYKEGIDRYRIAKEKADRKEMDYEDKKGEVTAIVVGILFLGMIPAMVLIGLFKGFENFGLGSFVMAVILCVIIASIYYFVKRPIKPYTCVRMNDYVSERVHKKY